jgi:hypothetical protein
MLSQSAAILGEHPPYSAWNFVPVIYIQLLANTIDYGSGQWTDAVYSCSPLDRVFTVTPVTI